MEKGVKSLRKLFRKEGPPVIQVKDPFAHWHPRHERAVVRKIYEDLRDEGYTTQQIKEMALRKELPRSESH